MSRRSLRSTLALCGFILALGGARGLRADFDENGWIVDWLVYGPLIQSNGPNPAADIMRKDFITDGATNFESTLLPVDGMEITPDFLNAAASEGFHAVLNGETAKFQALNTVTINGVDTADFNLFYAMGNAENAICYACVYMDNQTGGDLNAFLDLASDDSIQVKLDDCEAFLRSIGRGFGAAGTIQDRPAVTITKGAHRLLVKVFNGVGGFGFRLRVSNSDGTPITDLDGLSLSLVPADFGLTKVDPVGVGVSRTLVPDKLLGLDKTSIATLTASKTYPLLADTTPIVIKETIPDGATIKAGTANPPPSSTVGTVVTWNLTVAQAITGITYELQFAREVTACMVGQFQVGNGASCTSGISGDSCVAAVALNGLFLGDIVGGGDGTGNKPPDNAGILIDTGLFFLLADLGPLNGHTSDTDGINPAPVDESDLVDSVFFMNATPMAINTAGVEYDFDVNDVLGTSWNNILSNITHDIDKGVGNIRCAGQGPFATGVGVHASAGVTFDLDGLRKKYGADKIVSLDMLAGVDDCGGNVTLYVIYSNTSGIVGDPWIRHFRTAGGVSGEKYNELIPAEATFLTFATGDNADGDGCDHGVFAEARIFPQLPVARIIATPDRGAPPLNVHLDGSTSTAPSGQSITTYSWDLGDGNNASGPTIDHTYAQGRYVVKLTVTTDKFTSQSTTKKVTALFAVGDVSPWIQADIGDPYTPGGASSDGSCITVVGGGIDFFGTADQGEFVYQNKSGDTEIDGRLQEATFDPSGRAGLMMRASLDAASAFVYIQYLPTTNGLKPFISSRGTTPGDVVKQKTITFNTDPPNAFLRLKRTGQDFVGSVSANGTDWTDLPTITIADFPVDMKVGMAVTARDSTNDGSFATIKFCDLSFGGGPPPGQGFRRGDSNADGGINITDGIYVLNFLFLGGPDPPCMDAADANDDGGLNITDGIYILNFLFLGGTDPPAPGPTDCGKDTTPSDPPLGCLSYPGC